MKKTVKDKRKVAATVATVFTLMCSSFATLHASAFVDPNGDGVLNLQDAIYVSKYLAGKIYPTNISKLDYDGNGVVSEMDVYKIALAIS